MLLFFLSCKDKNEHLIAFVYDPEVVPTMITDSVTTLISDSGITRYKLVTEVWKVFDKAKEPYWYFPEGIYLEQFTPDFNTEATVTADTAWYYSQKDLWKLTKNVHVENMEGDIFESEELYWDQKNKRVYSDQYIEIKRGVTEMKGYGFESNEAMNDYRIIRPHDGKLPFTESTPADSLQSDSLLTEGPQQEIGQDIETKDKDS
jgi:LPS export ABC transporter protein LptC